MTLVCRNREPHLAAERRKQAVLSTLRELRSEGDFKLYAWVILDNHVHLLLGVPAYSSLSTAVGRLKQRLLFESSSPRSGSRASTTAIIRDDQDLQAHFGLHPLHPCKHRVVGDPAKYRWSSLGAFLKRGQYLEGWGTGEQPKTIRDDTGSE
ncbi:MAG: transposase [Lysobacterales bacterium]